MNILLVTGSSREGHYMLESVLDEFEKNNHKVYILCPTKREEIAGKKIEDRNKTVYLTRMQYPYRRINLIRKGMGVISLDRYFKRTAKSMDVEHIDLILYSTPPITLVNTVKYLKHRFNCRAFLMLKDIFPQNAVDIEIMKRDSLVHRYFRSMEKRMYKQFDYIGCISEANIDYMLEHYRFLQKDQVGLCVNTYPNKKNENIDVRRYREKYGLPDDKIVFIYGGNLGKPQGIDFLLQVLEKNADRTDRVFLIVGEGTEQARILKFVNSGKATNVIYKERMPIDEYDRLVQACDIGMVFLDYRFTIPNFPSRALSYMQYGMPIYAATDPVSDMKDKIQNSNMGWWNASNDADAVTQTLDQICADPEDIREKGKNAKAYLDMYYHPRNTYMQIMDALNNNKEGLFRENSHND